MRLVEIVIVAIVTCAAFCTGCRSAQERGPELIMTSFIRRIDINKDASGNVISTTIHEEVTQAYRTAKIDFAWVLPAKDTTNFPGHGRRAADSMPVDGQKPRGEETPPAKKNQNPPGNDGW